MLTNSVRPNFPNARSVPHPFSTGHHPRFCRVCGASFTGLGTLCPIHLAQYARQRAQQLKHARTESAQIIAAREARAQHTRSQPAEYRDELDA